MGHHLVHSLLQTTIAPKMSPAMSREAQTLAQAWTMGCGVGLRR